MPSLLKEIDPVALNQWLVVSAIDELRYGVSEHTQLLDHRLKFVLNEDGTARVWLDHNGEELSTQVTYGYIWTSLGTPEHDLFPIPEYAEEDRRKMNAISVGVRTSAPRIVENFLDMGHFPFVHTDILGVEPHTEVKEYDVDFRPEDRELIATNCKFWQPKASAASIGGVIAEYIYRVPHPFCSVLYKTSPDDDARMDAIAVFAQPLTETTSRAHLMICVIDHQNELDSHIRLFQQTILGQDKPILDNQRPSRLPLDPRAETPIRADKVSILYRRWLRDLGLGYGTIPEAA